MVSLFKRKVSEHDGQSTIEFALTLILLFTFSMFFLKLAMFFGVANYVHYATFMSARAYLSAGEDRQGDQVRRARDVIVTTLKKSVGQSGTDRWPLVLKAEGGGGEILGFNADPPSQYSDVDSNSSWMQGVRYTFKGNFFLAPLGVRGERGNTQVNSMSLTSESWLGREPNYNECAREMGRHHGLFDNGC